MNTQRAAELLKVAAEYIRDEETCPWPTLVYDGGERTAMELAMDLERVAVELEAIYGGTQDSPKPDNQVRPVRMTD